MLDCKDRSIKRVQQQSNHKWSLHESRHCIMPYVIMAMMVVDDSSLQADSQPKSGGLV